MDELLNKIRELQDLYDDPNIVTTADQINRPEPKQEIKDIEAINSFMKRNPRADGGRIELKRGTDGPGSGTRTDLDYINLTRLQNAKSKNVRISDASKFKYLPNQENITYTDYKDKKTGKVTRKYNVRVRQNVDGVQKVLTKGDEFQNITSLNKAKKIRDDFRKANPKNIQPRDPLKDYLSKDERRKYEVLKQGRMIKFGAGKGSVVHHMLPLAGKANVTTSDLAKISAKMNTNLSQFDKPMNKLVNEAYALDFSKEGSLKRLNEINKELAGYVKQSVKKLGPQYKGLLGFNKLTPVLDTFDKKGNQVFEEVPQGLDFKKSIAGKKGGEPVRNIKTRDIQKMVSDAPLTKVLKNVGKVVKPIGYAFGANALKTAVTKADEQGLNLNFLDKAMAFDSGDAEVALNNARRRVDPEFAAQERAKDLAQMTDDFEEVGQQPMNIDLTMPKAFAYGGRIGLKDGLSPDQNKSMGPVYTTNKIEDAAKEVIKRLIKLDGVDLPLNEKISLSLGPDLNQTEIRGVIDILGGELNIGGGFKGDKKGIGFNFYKQFADGGGVKSGPPPESGPNSQGLPGLLKRGMKI